MYVDEGLSLAEVGEALPEVGARTIADWSVKYEWPKRRQAKLSQDAELSHLAEKIQLRAATEALAENPDPQRLYALCRVIAVLKPATAVLLRKLDKEEAEGQAETAEERMAKVLEILRG